VACGILAAYPAGVNAAHTVLLEPWAVLFCLLGALAVFERDELTRSTGRLTWAGAAFGFAAAIKLWAFLPVLVVAGLLLGRRQRRRASVPYLGGVAGAFATALLPFAALAPRALVHDVVVAQLSRVDLRRLSEWDRLASVTGITVFWPVAHVAVLAAALLIAAIVLGCVIRAWRLTRRPPPPLERFALLTAGLVVAAFLWPPDYYLHYGWFLAPFLALAVALPVARLASVGAARPRAGARAMAAPVFVAVAVSGLVVITVVQLRQEARLLGDEGAAAVARRIPAGACVFTDISSLTVVADRFVSDVPGCSPIVDSIGTDYALADGRNGVTGAGRFPALRALWLSALSRAQYVWLACGPVRDPGCKTTRRIPWTPALLRYLRRHFMAVRSAGPAVDLFVRRAG
jgi:hypothetical protein